MRIVIVFGVVAVWLAVAATAHAAPWFDAAEGAIEDQYTDGDLDAEDPVVLRLGDRGSDSGTGDIHGESWVSLVGFVRVLRTGKNDVGAQVVVGLALDRLAAGSVHRLADRPQPTTPQPEPRAPPERDSLVSSTLANACVAAAWRASGLGIDDERIDALEARARASAILPETRLRAMRLWTDATHATTLAATDATDYYAAVGANLVLEGRLTWKLDRLVYAGDEPTLERVRLERLEARAKLAERTLQNLFAWARARLDAREAPPASREEADALLRAAEAEATLDVLTGGWFSGRTARPGPNSGQR
jgi:hypothetical protein